MVRRLAGCTRITGRTRGTRGTGRTAIAAPLVPPVLLVPLVIPVLPLHGHAATGERCRPGRTPYVSASHSFEGIRVWPFDLATSPPISARKRPRAPSTFTSGRRTRGP